MGHVAATTKSAIRGTFANIRLRNQLVPGVEVATPATSPLPDAPQTFIYDAAVLRARRHPAGHSGGQGTVWVIARLGRKGHITSLGVRVVIAQSYERIHRSNLIGMGVLPRSSRR